MLGNKTEGALLLMAEAAGYDTQALKGKLLHLDDGDKVMRSVYFVKPMCACAQRSFTAPEPRA